MSKNKKNSHLKTAKMTCFLCCLIFTMTQKHHKALEHQRKFIAHGKTPMQPPVTDLNPVIDTLKTLQPLLQILQQ